MLSYNAEPVVTSCGACVASRRTRRVTSRHTTVSITWQSRSVLRSQSADNMDKAQATPSGLLDKTRLCRGVHPISLNILSLIRLLDSNFPGTSQ